VSTDEVASFRMSIGTSASTAPGSVSIEGDSLIIKLMGIKSVSKITAPPKNVDNKWVMELDGITYTKQ